MSKVGQNEKIISFKVGKKFLTNRTFCLGKNDCREGKRKRERERRRREKREEREKREKRERKEPMSNQCYYQTKQSKRKQKKR